MQHADFDIHIRRPFIDGLRAISVLSVVLYHAGTSHITGGFVGVDIFFVISGFLIINQIGQDLARGTFTFSGFWGRRAIRILPPYLLVILVSAVIGYFVLVMPGEFASFGTEIAYSGAMIVNYLFLSQEGYFQTAAEAKPLLHLWSLAVEEQFYLVAPLLTFALWRLSRAISVTAAISLAAISFALCVYFTAPDVNHAFYQMPMRAWEFLMGGAVGLAVPFARKLPRRALEAVAVLGLILIGYAVFGFTPATPFPSYWAAVPVLGATLVLLTGATDRPLFTARFLSLSPFVGIGLVSYSYYLWHWPLLVFSRIYTFGTPDQFRDIYFGAVLPLVLAIFTYLFLERPLLKWRRSRRKPLRWRPVVAGVTANVIAVLTGMSYAATLSPSLPATTAPPAPGSVETCQLWTSPDRCGATPGGGLLWGDSHAQAAYLGLSKVLPDLTLSSTSGCAPFVGVRSDRGRGSADDQCEQELAATAKILHDDAAKFDYAILSARWQLYVPDNASRTQFRLLSRTASDPKEIFISGLRASLDALEASGVQRILILSPTPEFRRQPPVCAVRSDRTGVPRDRFCSVARGDVERRRALPVEWIAEAIAGRPNVRVAEAIGLFCDNKRCRPNGETDIYFADDNHLSETGGIAIYQHNKADFDWLLGKAGS